LIDYQLLEIALEQFILIFIHRFYTLRSEFEGKI